MLALPRSTLLALLVLLGSDVWSPVLVSSAASRAVTGATGSYLVQPGDSLTRLAARYGIGLATLALDNDLAPSARLRPNQGLRIDNRHIVPSGFDRGIVINVPQRMLFVWSSGRLAAAYPVAVGRADWPTPVDTYEIGSMEIDPSWEVPPSIQREMASKGQPVITVVPPGPANPLGDRWLGLKGSTVGIHGTNQPASIYRFTTHGCVRLHPADARELFELVEVGSPVQIIYDPVLAAVDDGGRVWLEVHPDPYRKGGDALARATSMLEESGAQEIVDPLAVARCVRQRAGRACEVRRYPSR
jgi:L,D-transpeptidase ErfK/SrfK